mmetsp:Transcript_12006/g.17552  ORF Transcript_12006/g.17552 Transcript_12006/m.17552 type:complete len:241 (-) Transcript_12006:173-895(-)
MISTKFNLSGNNSLSQDSHAQLRMMQPNPLSLLCDVAIADSSLLLKEKPKGSASRPISLNNSANIAGKRFNSFQEKKWNLHLEQFRTFKKIHGHPLVPHTFPENQHLARWVKRQRRQYKLMLKGQTSSNMTEERVDILNKEGFIWDSHDIIWRERFKQLFEYKNLYGHTRVPSSCCKGHPGLANWVKCQRRQHKLFLEGKRSSISAERTQLLNDVGFIWEVNNKRSSEDYDIAVKYCKST